MKSMSRVAFAAALFAGVGGLALSAPVAAQKKGKEEKGAGLKLTPDVQKGAAAAQTALAAKDFPTAEAAIVQIEGAVQSDDDRYIAAALRLQLEANKMSGVAGASDVALKAPLDVLLVNPKTPAANLPGYAFQRGLIAYNAKAYPEALQYFERARSLGYTANNIGLQIVKAKMDSGDIAGGSAELEKVIDQQTAAGGKGEEELYRFGIAKTNQKRLGPQTLSWIKRYIAAYPTTKNFRDVLVTYGLQSQGVAVLDKGQKVDLYRLMRASKAMADQYDYEIYGQFVYDLGLPYEAKTVLTEGKAAGKIPAGSDGAEGVLKAANAAIAAEGSLTPLEARSRSAANGKLAAGTADAYLGSGNYAKAIELYRVALEKGSVDADAVNTHLGIALAMSGDKAAAKTAFAAVKAAPRADIAGFWTTWIDTPLAAVAPAA